MLFTGIWHPRPPPRSVLARQNRAWPARIPLFEIDDSAVLDARLRCLRLACAGPPKRGSRGGTQRKSTAFFRATGMIAEELPALRRDDPALGVHEAAWDQVHCENPDSEDGRTITWNKIDDELSTVVKAMIAQQSRSPADLAGQAEALLQDSQYLEQAECPMKPPISLVAAKTYTRSTNLVDSSE
jgi:hypothetical protein